MKRFTVQLAAMLATAATPFLATALAPAAAASGVDPEVRVLTRNVYIGADIFRVFEVDPLFVINEIAAVYQTVLATDFDARAEALADEILATDPHLIGLQEVSLLRRQEPSDFLLGNPVSATEVELDYLQSLLDALEARGLFYDVASVVENVDVELPLIYDLVYADIRLTDRDVILVRSDVATANAAAGNYTDKVVVDLAGIVIPFDRGWTAVDATVDGRQYRFVNTHLEVGGDFGAAIQTQQAAELVSILDTETLPLIVLGDINASPESPTSQAYGQLVANGYTDIWLAQDLPGGDGLTCCFDETLVDETSTLSSRIDVVFLRNGAGSAVQSATAEVLGDEPDDRTESGLWPSDHAGVFAAITMPPADTDSDGVTDSTDNCIGAANPDQRDTDADGYGNLCDADFNQDGFVNFADLAVLRMRFMSDDPDADLDGSGMVNMGDVARFKELFLAPPGPSAQVP